MDIIRCEICDKIITNPIEKKRMNYDGVEKDSFIDNICSLCKMMELKTKKFTKVQKCKN